MTTITPRQKEILEFIRRWLGKHGYPPALREISAHFKMSGTRAVEKHISALAKKGYLRKGAGARALDVAGRAYGRAVPIVGQVAAGKPILAEENFVGHLTLDPSLARSGNTFLLKVKGESMRDAGILNNDMVLVRPQTDANTRDIVVALLDGEATVKQLIKRSSSIVLQPANPDFSPIVIDEGKDFSIVGKVVGVIRI